jgi:microcystin-dependent protein
LSQRRLDGVYFSNSSATDQDITETNLSYLANLQYVQDWVAQAYKGFMEIIDPVFTGTMTGSNINLTGELSVVEITSNTNFTEIPTITVGSTIYNVSTVPAGTIKMLISSISPPAGYLLCNGASYLSTDYPNLFSVIEYTYGGSGSNFNVPNFESYFPIGGNGSNSSGCATSNYVTGNNTSGATNTFSTTANFGGSSTEIAPLMTAAPSHNHNITDPGHTHETVVFSGQQPYLTLPPLGQSCVTPSGSSQLSTVASSSNVIIANSGSGIQTTDPISGLIGVNASPPYLAVHFYIATG